MNKHGDYVSKYHGWFVELGYPELDVNQFPDGSWEIIQYFNRPIIPSLTRYQAVLSGLKNIEISRGFIEKYVGQVDMARKEFWRREEAQTALAEREHAATEKHRQDSVARAAKAITQNPDLMDRIARNGLQEMDPTRIARHIPRARM